MPKKILLVEDEESISSMYKMKFDRCGFETVIAEDGEKALQLVCDVKPDVILLDIIMPKLDGYQVLKRLKADEQTKNIKVYMLSNLGQSGEVEKGFTEGADGFMIKSNLTPSQLVKNVQDILDGKTIGEKKPQMAIAVKSEMDKIKETKLAKVLLVEDSEMLLGMYKLALSKNGFDVETAQNGAWAVKLAKTKLFDIIIMDMVMPTMDGREAIGKLKADKSTKKIPIIVLSNSAQDRELDEAKKMGTASYLLKSQITSSKLVNEIKRVLKIN